MSDYKIFHKYVLQGKCDQCSYVRSVTFQCSTKKGRRYTDHGYYCVFCLYAGPVSYWKIEDQVSVWTLQSQETIQFHYWLEEDRPVSPSDLAHPNRFIREEAKKRCMNTD